MNIKKGDKIKIDGSVAPQLVSLGFDPVQANSISNRWACCNTTAKAVWSDDKQTWVTVDLCVEIPVECCRLA